MVMTLEDCYPKVLCYNEVDENSSKRMGGFLSSHHFSQSSMHSVGSLPTLRLLKSVHQTERAPSAEARRENLVKGLESLIEEDNKLGWESVTNFTNFDDGTENK